VSGAKSRRHAWARLPTQELLDVRLCDLGVSASDPPLGDRVARLHRELAAAGFRFRPSVWLSTTWFSPTGVPGFAIPFYLAHPRLRRLEQQMMVEVEGGTERACLRLLRHETAHALDHAYGLHRRPRWRRQFGAPGVSYRSTYVPRPASRAYVIHLDNWYAQSHPLEDFAETFAVWLAPRSGWRRRYRGWPALRKLEYVDELMREIAPRPPRHRSRERTESLPQLGMTLREYYRRKQSHYGSEDFSIYDRDLRRLFGQGGSRRTAASYLRARRAELRRAVSSWTGQHPYVVDRVLRDMIVRARDLKLRLIHDERTTGEGAAALLTMHASRLVRRRSPEYYR
jgi:hypothetical protein